MHLFERMKEYHIPNVRIDEEEWRKEYGNTYNTIAIDCPVDAKIAFAEDVISIYLLREAERSAQLLREPRLDTHCEHDWINAGEQVIENAKFCTLCREVRSS